MRKLIVAGAAFAALGFGVADAADLPARPNGRQALAVHPSFAQQGPRGVAGARWGNLCWVDVDSGRYSGYWGQCRR